MNQTKTSMNKPDAPAAHEKIPRGGGKVFPSSVKHKVVANKTPLRVYSKRSGAVARDVVPKGVYTIREPKLGSGGIIVYDIPKGDPKLDLTHHERVKLLATVRTKGGKLVVDASDDELEALDQAAQRRNRSRSEVIREALLLFLRTEEQERFVDEQYLAAARRRQPPEQLAQRGVAEAAILAEPW